MRIILGFLSGVLGMVAFWLALGLLVINVPAPGRDLGDVFMAFCVIAPFGGLLGLVIGVWLFRKFGVVHEPVLLPRADQPAEVALLGRTRISRPFATAILMLACASLLWGSYELLG